MKLKHLLSYTLTAALLSLSSTANAEFFDSPFDMWDDNNNYNRYDRGGRGYGADRWRRYDEWEPNYWRYRYFDDDSDDYFFDEFDGDFFGDGRGDFNFDMNMDFETDSRFDGDYDNDYRYRGDRRRYGSDYDRPTRRYGSDSYGNDRYGSDRYGSDRYGSDRYGNDRYGNDDNRRYQNSRRSDSRRYGNSGRRMSETPEIQRRREERRAEQPVECR